MLFKPARAYGDLNSYDLLKLIALFTMIVDHLGLYIWPDEQWLRAIGRLAFPCFLFLVGYSARWQVRRDLLIWAALIVLTAGLTHHVIFPLNILVTIACTRLAMELFAHQKITPLFLGVLFFIALLWYPLFIWTDYSTLALLFAMSGYLQRIRPRERGTLAFLYGALLVHFGKQYLDFQFSAQATVIMLVFAGGTAWLMHNFRMEPAGASLPDWLKFPLLWASRNTLPLYALHVMLLMILERLLFPERLLHFQWM